MAKKTYQTLKYLRLRTSALAVASCLALTGLPLAVQAAGLGKVTVFSALGQPLRAEVELSATRDELSGMKAQLASPDAFKQAGLDYAATLMGIKFSIDKRANGQSIIRLSSDKPINDPFVDMLLELNWPAGRLVREYTFLLDPPEVAAKAAAAVAPIAPVVAKPVPAAKPVVEMRAESPIDEKLLAKPEPKKPRVQEQTKQATEGGDTHEVKRGDSLNKIANAIKPEGVSLDQMLVGLFRANQEAFDGGNMNRLKAGKILSVPEKSALEAVSEGEAKKIVVAQSSDWNAYRRKLAGVAAQAPVAEAAGKQQAAGKITAKVEDKAAPVAEPKDQVKVSKTEGAAGKAVVAGKRSEEDLIAKEKALKEANERLAILTKNNADLEKLLALKNQNLADLQKQAAAKVVPAEVKKPVADVAPVVAPAPVPAPVVVAPVKPEPVPVAAPVVVEKPAEKPVEKAVEVKPEPKPEPKPDEMPKPKPVAPPQPQVEEPGFVDELLDNPIALAGGGGILALLAGFFLVKRRRQAAGEKPLATDSMLLQQAGDLSANSVFRSTGGQSVDTSHTPAQTDFSQAGPGSIDTDEVDPVAEADVYMAYGRDAQAEEILLEAKQKDPKRYAIHVKLLEIYSNRKSLKQFEALATDLYSETGGVGAEWEKAAAMGAKLDPQNPLFGGSAQVDSQSFDADATVIVSPPSLKNTVTMPGQLSQLADAASAAAPMISIPGTPAEEVAASSELMSLDFDLGMGDASPAAPVAEVKQDMESTLTIPEPVIESAALDFNIDTSSDRKQEEYQGDATAVGLDFNLPEDAVADVSVSASPQPEAALGADLDFDIGFDSTPAPAAEVTPVADAGASDMLDIGVVNDHELEFDVSLTESTVLGQPMRDPSFDMSSINLDLAEAPLQPASQLSAPAQDDAGSAAFEVAQMSTVVNADFAVAQLETVVNPQFGSDMDLPGEFDISPNEEVATKLDLAKAYEEMGDLEGARELLQEVLKEGDATQQEKAQAILAKIAV